MTSYTCEPAGSYSKTEESSESWITFVASTSIALSHIDLHPQALVHFRLLQQHVHLLSLQLLHLQLRHPRTGLGAGVSMEMLFTFTLQPCPCGASKILRHLIVRTHTMFIYSILTWGQT